MQSIPLYIEYPSWIHPEVVPFLPIRWYAIMYLVAFYITYRLVLIEIRKDNVLSMKKEEVQDLFFYCIIGLVIGARVFSCLFYNDGYYYLTHPWMMFWPFENGSFVGLPGMSYHGGVVGCFIGGLIYAHKTKRSILRITDAIVTAIPLGYTFGRLGNFINGELYGRISFLPFAMVFPNAERFSTTYSWVRDIADKMHIEYAYGDLINFPRHPAQLYEALFEGIVLFFILWFVIRPLKIRKNLRQGTIFSFYLMGYGIFRFFIEYFRQPDDNIGYVIALGENSWNIHVFSSFLNISKGQIFCLLMVLSGALLLFVVNKFRITKYD